jgi:hypothetical protein
MNEIPSHHNYGSKERFPPSDDDLSDMTLLKSEKKKPFQDKMKAILIKAFYREKDRFEWK